MKDENGNILDVLRGKESVKVETSVSMTTILAIGGILSGALLLWGLIRYFTK